MILTKPRPYLKVLRNSIAADLEYRINYYILILASFVTVFMELAVFNQIYAHQSEAGGLYRSQVVSFIVLGMLIRQGCSHWSLVNESVEQIRDGSFRKFLLQPVHYPSYFLAQAIGPKVTTWSLSILAVIVLKQFPAFDKLLPTSSLPYFFVALFLAYALVFQIYLFIVYLGFWVEESSFLNVAFNIGMGLFSGTLVPLSWLPDWIHRALLLTPFPLIGHFPLRTGLGDLQPSEWTQMTVAAVAWTVVLGLVNGGLRKLAYRSYESYGG